MDNNLNLNSNKFEYNIYEKCSPIYREEELESKILVKNKDYDKNVNSKNNKLKKAVPAKGEPHFKMGELISRLNVIKDDPCALMINHEELTCD